MRTPDYDTPSFHADDKPYIDELKRVLFRTGYDESAVGAIASGHMIRVAGGDPAAIERPYREETWLADILNMRQAGTKLWKNNLKGSLY